MHKKLQIGEIVNIHGVRGEIKVIPLTDNPERFESLDWFYVDSKGTCIKYFLESVKYLKKLLILKLKGVDTPEAAEALRGSFILVDRENAVKLPENSYFICDLIGLQVHDEDGVVLGKLNNVLQTGSNDVYVIKADNGREILIPALKSVVQEISLEAGSMRVKIPEGLLDDEI